MIDNTILACIELCQGLLNDYSRDIESALGKLPDEGGKLAISLGLKIEPQGNMTNKVDASLSFSKEQIKDKASRIVQEGQVKLEFKKAGDGK